MESKPRRRRLITTALALLLAIESVAVVGAAAHASVTRLDSRMLPAASPAGVVLAEAGASEPRVPASVADPPARRAPAPSFVERLTMPGAKPDEAASAPVAPSPPARASMPERPPRAATSKPAATTKSAPASSASVYTGRNHVWVPALKISRSISLFPCDRVRPPDNLVYRWGCAGADNLYLMGHAYSVFKPLHDAYVAGRLEVGMKAWHADAKGQVRVYAVQWWKVTLPTDASWAWAAQSTRSMTLQTCVGSDSQYRLVVRLVEVSG